MLYNSTSWRYICKVIAVDGHMVPKQHQSFLHKHDISGKLNKDTEWDALVASSMLPIMMSSSGNIFRVTGPLCGEFTGDRWIPFTKASDLEF